MQTQRRRAVPIHTRWFPYMTLSYSVISALNRHGSCGKPSLFIRPVRMPAFGMKCCIRRYTTISCRTLASGASSVFHGGRFAPMATNPGCRETVRWTIRWRRLQSFSAGRYSAIERAKSSAMKTGKRMRCTWDSALKNATAAKKARIRC